MDCLRIHIKCDVCEEKVIFKHWKTTDNLTLTRRFLQKKNGVRDPPQKKFPPPKKNPQPKKNLLTQKKSKKSPASKKFPAPQKIPAPRNYVCLWQAECVRYG